ncbi:NUDIX domain-containing protein [Anabaena sp. UHCC 0253]|uniref:NUDIX hydrolase n=1 Tax=Anabaena sp. UHCC 0253 TaxID=2590019 RepID=UPI001446D9A0|nr:NUDIX domain-containing protein [Anabaena sp. UHCC 0253]MTJ55878.1 NUDIX domain-containing protein [Anabaena sp. UHCC 0253]
MRKEYFTLIPSCHLILIKDNKILLLRRFNTGFGDGNYSVVAGHLQGNETFLESIIREAFEEARIKLNINDLKVAHVMHRKDVEEERIDFYIITQKWEGEPINAEPDKCDDLKWFDIDCLPNNTLEYIRYAIENIKKQIFYSEYGW